MEGNWLPVAYQDRVAILWNLFYIVSCHLEGRMMVLHIFKEIEAQVL